MSLFFHFIFLDVRCSMGSCFLSAHQIFFSMFLAYIVSLRYHAKSCGCSLRKKIVSFILWMLLRFLVVFGFQQFYCNILCIYPALLLCYSWICGLLSLINFGKILSNSFFKYYFCPFLLTLLSFCIFSLYWVTFSLCSPLPSLLHWPSCYLS